MKKDYTTEGKLIATEAYIRQNQNKAMRGKIERALAELITNSDDSYRDLEESNKGGYKVDGGIRIDLERRRENSIIRVRDRAEGMNKEEMIEKLTYLGKRTSGFEQGKARRGLHGRGAKDIASLGTVHFESIKDNEYAHLILRPDTNWNIDSHKLTIIDRDSLRIHKRNGTVAAIEINKNIIIPTFDHLKQLLKVYYSLRDICSNPKRRVTLYNSNKELEDFITYKYPEGEIVYNDNFNIPNYPEAKVSMLIKKHLTPFEQKSLPTREGILVKSKAAIHDCTYFGLEAEPFAWRFSGEIRCEYIDKLVREFDDQEQQNLEHPANNNIRILDPSRDGLILDHPFIESLFRICREKLSVYIEDLKRHTIVDRKNVSNSQLDEKLKNLSKLLSPIFEKELKEFEEESNDLFNAGKFRNNYPFGLTIIPDGKHSLIPGEKKVFSVIFKGNENYNSNSLPLKISSSNSTVKVNKPYLYLQRDDNDSTVGKGTFSVIGSEVDQMSTISVTHGTNQKIIYIDIVAFKNPFLLKDGLFFEKPSYDIIFGKSKKIGFYLKSNSYLTDRTVRFTSSNPDIVVLKGSACELKQTIQKGLMKGVCVIDGRRLKAKGEITAVLPRFESTRTQIEVVERNKSGINFDFKPVEDNFGIVRYMWEPLGSFNLKIAAKHPSIQRYLGILEKEKYTGIGSPLYHAVLAETIAEALAFRLLEKAFSLKGEGRMLDYSRTDNFFHTYFSKFLTHIHNSSLIEDSIVASFISKPEFIKKEKIDLPTH